MATGLAPSPHIYTNYQEKMRRGFADRLRGFLLFLGARSAPKNLLYNNNRRHDDAGWLNSVRPCVNLAIKVALRTPSLITGRTFTLLSLIHP